VSLFDPLLYFVSFGAILVLFASTVALLIWMLAKLRRLIIRSLGGAVDE
jgi:hypothetical protein